MMLAQALHYPFREKKSFRRLFILTLLQLLPVVGQLILLGYGLDVVRAVYAGENGLPSIRWQAALGNGCRFLLAGLGYLLPILITVGIIVGTMLGASKASSSGGFGSGGVISLLVAVGLPLLLVLIGAVVGKRTPAPALQRPEPKKPGGGFRVLLNSLLPVLMTILVTLTLSTLVSLSDLQTGRPNGLGILLLAIFALLILLIWIVLHIGGVRQAIENTGLFAPIVNLQLLLKHRALTARLLLKIIILGGVTVITTILGLVLFILPGLCAFVLCSLALWYLFAQYSRSAEMFPPGCVRTKDIPLPV